MDDPAPRYAFFDLDGTLLPWDTQLLFCNHVLRRHGWRRVLLLPFFALAPLAAVRLLGSRTMKRVFLGYLAGMKKEQLETHARDFARETVARHLWPDMLAELETRRREGCVLVLNTASPGIYADPIARELGFDHCLATRVELPPRMPMVARIDGPNNKRAAKIDAMRRYGPLSPGTALPIRGSWSYTDSPVDIPLLECAEHGVLVHPQPGFAAMAGGRGWKIVRPCPAVSRLAWYKAAMAMVLGVWK
jgi:HAD superfamily hydrolase (TIGR01490 family)